MKRTRRAMEGAAMRKSLRPYGLRLSRMAWKTLGFCPSGFPHLPQPLILTKGDISNELTMGTFLKSLDMLDSIEVVATAPRLVSLSGRGRLALE